MHDKMLCLLFLLSSVFNYYLIVHKSVERIIITHDGLLNLLFFFNACANSCVIMSLLYMPIKVLHLSFLLLCIQKSAF